MLSGHHRETSTAGSECHTGMGDKEWLQVCSPQVQSPIFHCTTVSGSERIGNTLLPVEESTKFLGLWWDSHLSFKKHISVLKTQCKEALNLIRVVAHLKWGGDRVVVVVVVLLFPANNTAMERYNRIQSKLLEATREAIRLIGLVALIMTHKVNKCM